MIKPNMIPKRNYFKKYTNDEIIDFILNLKKQKTKNILMPQKKQPIGKIFLN
jgi:hypothetical protein